MKNLFLVSSVLPLVLGGVVLAGTTPVYALDFPWQFTTNSSSTGGGGQLIQGTLSDLVEGVNTTGVTADVTSAPNLTGLYNNFVFGQFTVTGGAITFASALFTDNSGDLLWFGSDPSNGTFFPELNNGNYSLNYVSNTVPTAETFTAQPVPEPLNIAGTIAAGAGLISARWKQHKKQKALPTA